MCSLCHLEYMSESMLFHVHGERTCACEIVRNARGLYFSSIMSRYILASPKRRFVQSYDPVAEATAIMMVLAATRVKFKRLLYPRVFISLERRAAYLIPIYACSLEHD